MSVEAGKSLIAFGCAWMILTPLILVAVALIFAVAGYVFGQ